jgi:Cof subfamily protein (haloacid dehalogenase superfamily)
VSSTGRQPEARLPIRLIALDIDGTLVDDDLLLRDRTRAAVRAAVERGVHVSLATGRMASSAVVFAEALGIRDPIVAFQGALVREMPAPGARARGGAVRPVGRIISHEPLAAEVAKEAIRWSRAHGLEPHVNHLERFILPQDDPRADDYSSFLGARARFVPDLEASVRRPVTKVISVGDPRVPMELLAEGRAAFAGRAEVTLSHPRFLEFVAPGVSKGRALARLARRSGVPLSQVLAVGDQWNDAEMIVAAGHGAAMPSAPAAIRRTARYVVRPLVEEGAARLIEDLVLASPAAAARNLVRWLEDGARARAAAEAELAASPPPPSGSRSA